MTQTAWKISTLATADGVGWFGFHTFFTVDGILWMGGFIFCAVGGILWNSIDNVLSWWFIIRASLIILFYGHYWKRFVHPDHE